ncbi:RICIN domain-containing protein [Streptomyces sp. NPDC046915]|uniref:RICIN domain-containing protein n=1 Tax=Streptomyces sp. NPDC046915 TaxID=3155257 RepID=UPI0033D3AD99
MSIHIRTLTAALLACLALAGAAPGANAAASRAAVPLTGPWFGPVRLLNPNSGRCLGIANGNAGIWDCTTRPDQEWSVGSPSGNLFLIENGDNQCLNVSGGQGAQVIASLCNLTGNMFWSYATDANGHRVIKNEQTRMILGVYGGRTANGSEVVQWADTDGADQDWALRP